ncbi:MAG: hypothetical protein JNL01_02385 [Bdellovibrionales bacterium]|nr:hypothetical protein [Bdellovibrionales bacterium]
MGSVWFKKILPILIGLFGSSCALVFNHQGALSSPNLFFQTFVYEFKVGLGTIADNSGQDLLMAVTTDSDGNTYTCGTTSSDMFSTRIGGDVIIIKFDVQGNFVWGVQWNSTSQGLFSNGVNYDVCNSITMGPSNTLYVAGYTRSQLFGAATFSGGSLRDAWVARINASDGSIVWGNQLTAAAGLGGCNTFGTVDGDTSEELGGFVTTDSSGNLFLYGTTQNAGANNSLITGSAANTYLWVAHFQASGTCDWIKQLIPATGNGHVIGNATENAGRIQADSSGNAYFVGATTGAFAAANAGSNDVFLGKINSAGTVQYIKQFTPAVFPGVINAADRSETLSGVALDSSGNVYVQGHTGSQFSGPSDNTGAVGTRDLFLARLTSSGSMTWVKQISTVTFPAFINDSTLADRTDDAGGGSPMGAIGIDGNDQIYIGGTTQSSLVSTNTNVGLTFDAVIFKFNSSGSMIWAKQASTANPTFASRLMASASDEYVADLSVRSDGNLAIVGCTTGNFIGTYGGGAYDTWMIHLDKNGNL